MVLKVKRVFSYKFLKSMTDNFSEENFISNFQFGKVYRGLFHGEEVTVKIWEDDASSSYIVNPGDNLSRLNDEVKLLEHFTDEKSHPTMVYLIGYTWEEGPLACVYQLKSLDTLHNLITKDGFTWPQRIKVALGFASFLEFMHAQNPPYLPYLIRNVDAAHIMVDQDYNPILFDFSMISGGILTDRRNLLNQYVHGCYGYVDPSYAQGGWSEKCDIFAYGVVLLGLITKRVYTEEDRINRAPFIYEWAKSEYKLQKSKSSLVHQSLGAGPLFWPSDGIKIVNLAMQCVQYNPQKRPTMKHIVRCLLQLRIVRRDADTLGIDQMLSGDDAKLKMDNISGFWRSMIKKSDFKPTCIHINGRMRLVPLQEVFSFGWSRSKWCSLFFFQSVHNERILYKGQRSPTLIREGKEHSMMQVFSYEDLRLFTNGFSEENFIGKFQFGKVYHGEIEARKVTVKIWEDPVIYAVYKGDNEARLRDELAFLQHPKLISHPNLVNLIGYCHEGEHLGVVYDLDSLDTVYNLLVKGSFTWSQRIKVGFGFARILKFLHACDPPYLVRNIDAAHVMLDQNYNPKLFDFGMISGGIFPDRTKLKVEFVHGCYGYVDCYYAVTGQWSEKCDVFAFGVVLLSLIAKRVYTEEDRSDEAPPVYEWAESDYDAKMSELGSNQSKVSLVHGSLEAEPGFYSSDGPDITELAMQCVEFQPHERPTMKQVVKRLLNLRIVRHHAVTLGSNQMLHGHGA